MDLDPLLLSRIQFAFVVSFHIIFPAFTIGLAAWLATIEGMRLATGKPVYRRVFDFWLKVFALSFGMGVVSGIVMAFQFGTNWSVLAERTGPIQGPLLGYEGFTAFMLDGLKDGRTGRSPYFWTLLRNPRERIERLNEGLNATARIILLGLVMDAIYQIIVLKRFSPAEAVIVASLFAFVPYVIIRGPVVRIERRWLGAPLQTGSREGTDMNRRQKDIEHGRFTHRRKHGQVRSTGNGRQPFRLDPHPPQRRAHDDVVAAHRRGIDRLRFRDRSVLQPLARDPPRPPRLSSNRAGILGLALISCGILALVISLWQYFWTVRYLWGGSFAPIAGMTKEGTQSPVIAVAILLIFIGIFAFFAVLFRLT